MNAVDGSSLRFRFVCSLLSSMSFVVKAIYNSSSITDCAYT